MTDEWKKVGNFLFCMFTAMGSLAANLSANQYTPWWALFVASILNSFLLTFCYIMGREDRKKEEK